MDCSRLRSLDSGLSIEPQLAAGLVTGSGRGMQSAGAGSVEDKDNVYTLDTAANKPGGWSVSKFRFIYISQWNLSTTDHEILSRIDILLFLNLPFWANF
mgnify:CR=1 FL=1